METGFKGSGASWSQVPSAFGTAAGNSSDTASYRSRGLFHSRASSPPTGAPLNPSEKEGV